MLVERRLFLAGALELLTEFQEHLGVRTSRSARVEDVNSTTLETPPAAGAPDAER